MPSDHPEPLELHHATPTAAAAKSSGKMHRLLRSAFKRGDSPHSAGAGEDADCLSRSVSGSSSSVASSGRPPSWRRAGRRGGDGSVDCDRSSRDSFELDGSNNSKLLSALHDMEVGHAYEPFPWEKKMRELLPVPEASCFLSMLLLPKATGASTTRYNNVEDTLACADAWLLSSQTSGVPIVFLNVQTESLLTKISCETALTTVNMGSLSDLAVMANAGLYGFEDYHGLDIGMMRAVRLWYTPTAGEAALKLRLRPGDTRLGFGISRTEEGFIYVSSVADEGTPGVASARSGLLELHRAARRASKLLVVSRVGGEKVLPWMVSTGGDIKCFDTVSLSQQLSLHRHVLRPITLHFLMWDSDLVATLPWDVDVEKPPPVLLLPAPLAVTDKAGNPDADGLGLTGDDGRDSSFTFQNIGLPGSWL